MWNVLSMETTPVNALKLQYRTHGHISFDLIDTKKLLFGWEKYNTADTDATRITGGRYGNKQEKEKVFDSIFGNGFNNPRSVAKKERDEKTKEIGDAVYVSTGEVGSRNSRWSYDKPVEDDGDWVMFYAKKERKVYYYNFLTKEYRDSAPSYAMKFNRLWINPSKGHVSNYRVVAIIVLIAILIVVAFTKFVDAASAPTVTPTSG
jgi:hypothetical protein